MPTCSRVRTALLGLLLFFVALATPALAQESDCFDLNAFAYTETMLDISPATANARATHWHPEGTMLFVTGRSSANVVGYAVEEPWTLTGATPITTLDLSTSVGTTDEGANAHGLFLRPDGHKLWVFNRTELWAFTLDAPWDLSSARQTNYRNLADFVRRGHDIDFSPDGARLFIDDREAQAVYAVDLATPWDIATGTLSATLDISAEEQAVRGIEFMSDGTRMLLMDTNRADVLKYRLSQPYDLTTASFVTAFDVSAQTTDPRGLSLSADGRSFFVTCRTQLRIFQYTTTATCR